MKQNKAGQEEWDIGNPKDCREWLKALRIGPQKAQITFLQDANGNQIAIDDASDKQVVDLCQEMATMIAAKENKA